MTSDAGESLGYGFVHYESEEAADQAIAKLNGMLLNGKLVYVGKFVPKKERNQNGDRVFTNIYVKNLPESMNTEGLRELFSECGQVTSCIVMEKDGKSREFGFVNFENPDDAKQVAGVRCELPCAVTVCSLL